MKKMLPLGFIFVGLCLALLAVPPQVETLQVAWEADRFESTTALVLSLHTKSHGKGPSTEVLEFDYTVDGRTYRGDNHLTQFDDSYEKLNQLIRWKDKKRFVQVYYDPDDPKRVLVHRDIGLMVPLGVIGLTAACLYVGFGTLFEERRIAKWEARKQAERKRRQG